MHRNSILIRSNEMQLYAGVYLLQNYSKCLGCLSHPSSGLHQTVTAASGTGHSVRATNFRQRGLISNQLISNFAVNKHLPTVAPHWISLIYNPVLVY